MKRNVLVTAVGGRSVGSGILHALTRSSDEVTNRWNVIATDADPFAWGLYKVDQSFLLPLAISENYIDSINRAIQKYDIQAVVPGSEAETSLLANNQEKITVPVICNRADLMPMMMDKMEMSTRLKRLGIPVIDSFSLSEWKILLSKYDFPIILKPTIGTGGSKGLKIIMNKDELDEILSDFQNPDRYCLQPYIGNGDEEYTVGILSDKEGSVIDSIVMQRKLIGLSLLDVKKVGGMSFPVSTGYSQGYFVDAPKIQSFCEQLALLLQSCGPLNIQLRVQNDQIFVFEVHPRFSGTSPMRADVGFNEPDILLRNHLMNERFDRRLEYKKNVAVIRAFEHVIIPIDKLLK